MPTFDHDVTWYVWQVGLGSGQLTLTTTTEYVLDVEISVSTVTIDARASDSDARVIANVGRPVGDDGVIVFVSFADAESNTDGERLNLNVGANVIVFGVTNGTVTRRCTVTIERAAS